MSQKVQTVNVVEIIDPTDLHISVTSFLDNDEGNREAEELMFKLAKENGYLGHAQNSEQFIEEFADSWSSRYEYSVVITHSK